MNQRNPLAIVNLMRPSDCVNCRFAKLATVEFADGSKRRMLHCTRLDCDNWQTEDTDLNPVNVKKG